jgi:hypothetical protein
LVILGYDQARGVIETWRRKHGQKWRFPQAFEAFAVASALPFDERLATTLKTFWILLGEQPAVFYVEWDSRNELRVVDYELAKNPAPQVAGLLAIKQAP